MDTHDATNAPADAAFQRSLIFSFQTRTGHSGNVTGAFLEFVKEPDIVAHWESLGPGAVAEMVASAVRLVHEAYKRGGGGILDFLPMDIRVHDEYAPLVDAARTLVRTMDHDGPTVTAAECVRLVDELSTDEAVAVFAALVMTIFPPRGGAQ